MNTQNYDIFISYRRGDISGLACGLYEELQKQYPGKVFLDTEEMKLGPWLDQLVNHIDHCKVFIWVVGSKIFDGKYTLKKEDKRYGEWAKMSLEDLKNDLKAANSGITEDTKIEDLSCDYVRLEVARALEAEQTRNILIVPIVYNGFDFEFLPDDIKVGGNQAISYDPTLGNIINDEFRDKLQFQDKLFLQIYAKLGKEIRPEELYHVKERASEKYGFDEKFYIPRKVDVQLSAYVEKELNKPFCYVTGLPGSGKTRAIYQLCHGALSEKNVVILNKDNIQTITNYIKRSPSLESCYFVCDQLVDVLSVFNDKDKQKEFITTICDTEKKYHLIFSNTKVRFDDLKYTYPDYITDQKIYKCEIPLIEEWIIKRLKKKFKSSKKIGKTVADFIPGVNEYVSGILNEVLIKSEIDTSFFEAWLRALQLVMAFRKEYRLFLAVLLVRELRKNEEIEEKLSACIIAMVSQNMLAIQNNGIEVPIDEIEKDDFLDLKNSEKILYDEETFENGAVINKKYAYCTFEINELIWQYIIDNKIKLKKGTRKILNDLVGEKSVRNAIDDYYKTFPTLSSLRRVIPRIPCADDQATANDKVIQILESNYIQSEDDKVVTNGDLKEIQVIYSLIIGRCKSGSEVEILEKINKITKDEQYPGNVIGELYRFAENNYDTYSEDYKSYINSIITKRSYIQEGENGKIVLKEQSKFEIEDLYAIRKEIDARLKLKMIKVDFESLYAYIKNCFDKLGFKEKENLLDDKTLLNVDKLLSLLVRYSNAKTENVKEIAKLLGDYKLLDQELGIYPLYTIFKYLAKYADGNFEKCACIIDQLIPIKLSSENEKFSCKNKDWNLTQASKKVQEFFGRFIVSAIAQADTFEDAKHLYELYVNGFGKTDVTEFSEEHVDKYIILNMAMRKCIPYEFQTMVNYVGRELQTLRQQLKDYKKENKQIEIWHVNYTIKVLTNLIMEKAPSQTDALYYIEDLETEQIDSYALFHILNKILKNQNRDEQFIWAYKAMNHPKLKQYQSEGQILNLVYRFTNDIDQESLVDEIAGEDWIKNRIYVGVKLGKNFRTLFEKWELYESFYNNANKNDSDNEGSKDQRYVDLFSTLAKEYRKCYDTSSKESKLEIEKIKEHLVEESKKDFIDKDVDPYYTFALIYLELLKVFDNDNKITQEFKKDHLKNFTKIRFWDRLIENFAKDDDKIKAICQLYKEEYEGANRPYDLRPNQKMRRSLKRVGISLNGLEDIVDLDDEIENIDTNETHNENNSEYDAYVDDNELIFTEEKNGKISLNEHFNGLKNSKEAQNVIWWTKKINWFKKQVKDTKNDINDKKCSCLFNAYCKFLKEHPEWELLRPDWMMYRYAYSKIKSRDIKEKMFDDKESAFNSCNFVKRELNDPTIILSRSSDVLEHLCILLKEKITTPTIKEIIEIIEGRNLWPMVEADHKSLVALYVFIIKQGQVGKEILSNYKEKFDKINHHANSNLKSLGELSREERLLTDNSLRHSFYFYQWLKVYLEIYKTEETFCKHYINIKDNTIKVHIQRHLKFDIFFKEYLNDNGYSSLITIIEQRDEVPLPQEILLKMLECYKKYTIYKLKTIYNDLCGELQNKLNLIEDNATIDAILDVLDTYATLRDDIIKSYQDNKLHENGTWLLKAAILGSSDSQNEYGRSGEFNPDEHHMYMIRSAAMRGNEDAKEVLELMEEDANKSKQQDAILKDQSVDKKKQLWDQAINLKKTGKYKEAIELFNRLINERIDKKYPESEIAQCYNKMGNRKASIEWYEKANGKGCFKAPYSLYQMYWPTKMYRNTNPERAIECLIISAERGYRYAKDELQQLPQEQRFSLLSTDLQDKVKEELNSLGLIS